MGYSLSALPPFSSDCKIVFSSLNNPANSFVTIPISTKTSATVLISIPFLFNKTLSLSISIFSLSLSTSSPDLPVTLCHSSCSKRTCAKISPMPSFPDLQPIAECLLRISTIAEKDLLIRIVLLFL